MKIICCFNILVTVLIGGLFTACSDDSAPYGETMANEYRLNVSDKDKHLTFDMDRTTAIRVNADRNIEWYVDSKPNWISVGNTGTYFGTQNLVVSVNEDNKSGNVRTGSIKLRTYRFNHETSIAVEQAGGYINAPDLVEFSAMSETKTIVVTANVSWKISMNSSVLSTVNPQDGLPGSTTVTLISKNNSKEKDDVEYLLINPNPSGKTSSDVPSKRVQLKRERVNLKAILDSSIIPQTGGSTYLRVESNSEWKVQGLDSWLKASSISGKKNQNISIQVTSPNTGSYRECSFYVVSGDVKRTLYIGQDGLPIPGEDDNTTPRYNKKK